MRLRCIFCHFCSCVAVNCFWVIAKRKNVNWRQQCRFRGGTIMIKHFNTYDVYQHSNFNIYSAKDMQYLDKLHSHCRYMFLEYLIDLNIIKHMIANAAGHVFILNIKLQGFWVSTCADFTREFNSSKSSMNFFLNTVRLSGIMSGFWRKMMQSLSRYSS